MDWVDRLLAGLEPWLTYWLGLMEGGSLLGLAAAALAGVVLGLSLVTYLLMPAVVRYAGGNKSTTRRRAAARSVQSSSLTRISHLKLTLSYNWNAIYHYPIELIKLHVVW